MASFAIQHFGCRATQSDAAALAHEFASLGYARIESTETTDIAVLHTCTVTAAADREAQEAVRTIHRRNPKAQIVIAGCYAQRAPEEVASLAGVSLVLGNAHRPALAELLHAGPECNPKDFIPLASLGQTSTPSGSTRGGARIYTGDISGVSEFVIAQAEMTLGERTRPVLKIQDGCNNRCAFCVLPSIRGRSRSLPAAGVVEEIARLVHIGYREIVLSGINLGAWGRDIRPRMNLIDLLRLIVEQTSVEQIRLSSIEPTDVTADLIELVARTGRIAPHFHIPLQSGSDHILGAMHRRYRASHYARRAELICAALPDAAIGADVIAGFPGETEADHSATCAFIEQLPFSYLHVFTFSARPGTEAAALAGPVPLSVAKHRAAQLRALGEKKKAVFRGKQTGRTLRVLTLKGRGIDAGGEWTEAISGNYLKVRVRGHWSANQWLAVRYVSNGVPLAAQPAGN